MKRYHDLVARKRAEYGDRFDDSDLNPDFVQYYNSSERVEVSFRDRDGNEYERKRGRIGVTRGWKPVFLLMARVDSTESSDTIGMSDRVIRVISK